MTGIFAFTGTPEQRPFLCTNHIMSLHKSGLRICLLILFQYGGGEEKGGSMG